MRAIVRTIICIVVLAVVVVPTLQLTSGVQPAGHHAGLKGRAAWPGGSRTPTATSTTPTLPEPLLVGRAPMLDAVRPALVRSRELFVPPRA